MVPARVAGVTIDATIPWVIWMVLAMLVALALVAVMPGLALWLPHALGYQV